MTQALTLTDEFRGINGRTWRSVAASVLLHVLLIGLLMLLHHFRPVLPVITEISWLEPEAPAPAPAPAALPPREELEEPIPQPARQFERRLPAAEMEPRPQVPAINDRLQSQLATTATLPERPAILSAGLSPSAALWQPAAPAAGPPTAVGAPVAMRRETAGAAPLALRRDAPGPSARLQAEAAAPAPAPALPEHAAAAPAARSLPGLSLTGPVAARPVLEHPMPVYPEWAKREAMEASVSLHFVVREDGSLKDNILVEKTSGYADFDNSALAALRGWRFAPLPAGVTGEQWGTITFHFRLRDDR